MRVIKRDGREVTYDRNKIIIAIHKANDEFPLGERISDEKIHGIVSSIEKLGANTLQVEEIQDIIEQKFLFVLEICERIFGKYAFRRMPDKNKRRTISKALFETWTAVLARYENNDLIKLAERRELLEQLYMPMFTEDEEFYKSLGSGNVYSVRRHFEKIQNLVAEVLRNA